MVRRPRPRPSRLRTYTREKALICSDCGKGIGHIVEHGGLVYDGIILCNGCYSKRAKAGKLQ